MKSDFITSEIPEFLHFEKFENFCIFRNSRISTFSEIPEFLHFQKFQNFCIFRNSRISAFSEILKPGERVTECSLWRRSV